MPRLKTKPACIETRPEPIDCTKNGTCSRCGGCCSSLIPVTQAEKDRLLRYAMKRNIEPQVPDGDGDMVYAKCPFLDEAGKKCLVYGLRPDICAAFRCDRTNLQNTAAYAMLADRNAIAPPAYNLWNLFGKTGLRIGGQEILLDNAPSASLTDDKGNVWRLTVGKAVQLALSDGTVINHALCIGIAEDGVQIFDGTGEPKQIGFGQIDAIY